MSAATQSLRRLETERQQAAAVAHLKGAVQQHQADRARGNWEVESRSRAALAAKARAEAEAAQAAAQQEVERRAAERLRRQQEEAEREAAEAAARVTPAQRRAALAEQARELAARREGERRRVAEERLALQFASSCDELRTLQSQRVAAAATGEWQAQLADKAAARVAASHVEQRQQREFEGYMQKYEDRYQQVRELG